MQKPTRIWHPLAFFSCNLLALLLLASWYYPPTRGLWDALDRAAFFLLNGSLAWGESWQLIWAWGNNRAFDVGSGLLMIGLFWIHILSGRRGDLIPRLVQFGIMSLLILASQEGVIDTYQRILEVQRASPSLVLEPVYRLSELVPQVQAKDASGSSFPGDHATVLLLWLGFVWIYAGLGLRITSLLLGLLIIAPRLVAGAHWLSDNLVGSGALVLLMLGWVLATPLGYLLKRLGTVILEAILPRRWQQPQMFR